MNIEYVIQKWGKATLYTDASDRNRKAKPILAMH